MKIFLSFLQGKPGHPIPAYDFWEYYIKKGIEESGYEWMEEPTIDWAEGLVSKSKEDLIAWRARVWEKTISFLKKNKVDFFLSYLYPHQIDVLAIEEIKQLGIPCVNFFCDNVREFKKIPNEFSCFNLNWVPEIEAIGMYKAQRINYLHIPMPMWVDPTLRTVGEDLYPQISFIGSKDFARSLFLDEVLSVGALENLFIYGNKWIPEKEKAGENTPATTNSVFKKLVAQIESIKHDGLRGYIRKLEHRNFNYEMSELLKSRLKGRVEFNDYIDLTRNSYVTTGINRYHNYRNDFKNPKTYSRLRDLEAPMLGACYLVEAAPDLPYLYEENRDIMVFKDAAEFAEKASILMSDKALRSKLRRNAQIRSLEELSIPSSLNKIISYLFQ